ncbi:MAG: hypothetical protein VYA34_16025 [Myxococcota bacterium]|nr:hypothetical protein [Myxococcota bacterium]
MVLRNYAVSLVAGLGCLLSFSATWAGNIGNNSNFSAEYIRTLNRGASVETDAAVYNPAGTVALADGFHFGLSNQSYFIKTDELSYLDGKTYESTVGAYVIPAISSVYGFGDFAIFLHLGVPGGGGSKDFSQGHPVYKDYEQKIPPIATEKVGLSITSATLIEDKPERQAKIKGTSVAVGATLGLAYQAADWVSLGAGLRLVHATRSYEGSASYWLNGALPVSMMLETSATALGLNPLISFNVMPVEDLRIAFQYQFKTPLNYKRTYEDGSDEPLKEEDLNAMIRGKKEVPVGQVFFRWKEDRRDLPAVANLGVSYQVTPELKLESSFNYYFNTSANWGKTLDGGPNGTEYRDGMDAGLAVEYAGLVEGLRLSVGYLFSHTGATRESRNLLDWGMSTQTVAVGGSYDVNEMIELSLGLLRVFYVEGDNFDPNAQPSSSVLYNQSTMGFALGANFHF